MDGAMRRSRKRVAGLLNFFQKTGKKERPRTEVLDGISDEDILAVLRLAAGKGRLVHELISYANINPKTSAELTKEDLVELRRLLIVSEVMDS
jgi:hypothetical protein